MIVKGNKYFNKIQTSGSMQADGKDKHNDEKNPLAFATHYRDMKADELMQTEWPPPRILVVDDEPMIRHLNCLAP
jgi:hypothetical protein